MTNRFFIIGCGGVGSWLTPALCALLHTNVKGSENEITLVDGDTLEEKNLDRQLFTEADIGKNKAEALGERYRCVPHPAWFSDGVFEFEPSDWIIVCVDNHAARLAALIECDSYRCRAMFAANETHSAEAFIYDPKWKGAPLDPRVYYPDILTDKSGDPRARAIGCTGEAQIQNPQLVTSNMLAASLLGHLFTLWHHEVPKMDADTIPYLPYMLRANETKLETHRIIDRIPKSQTNKGQTNERRNTTDGDGSSAATRQSETAGAAATGEH